MVSPSQELSKSDQPILLEIDTSAVLKTNCQMTPRITPPIRFGTKKNVRKIFELFNLAVTRRASPKATAFTAIIETITYLNVKLRVVQNSGSSKEFM